jgi:hypothetical protein
MKYEPLLRFLEARADANMIRLSFAEISDILGFSLPASARKHQAWWSNTRAGHSHAAAWLDAGWKTETLDLAGERVSFAKASSGGFAESPGAAFDHQTSWRDTVVTVRGLSSAALTMIDNYVKKHGGDRASACATLLDQLAIDRLEAMFNWFQQNMPRSDLDSVDLIREDRDSR